MYPVPINCIPEEVPTGAAWTGGCCAVLFTLGRIAKGVSAGTAGVDSGYASQSSFASIAEVAFIRAAWAAG